MKRILQSDWMRAFWTKICKAEFSRKIWNRERKREKKRGKRTSTRWNLLKYHGKPGNIPLRESPWLIREFTKRKRNRTIFLSKIYQCYASITYRERENILGGKIFLVGIFERFGPHSLLKFFWAILEKVLFYINSIYNQNKRFRKQSQYNKIILISRNTFAKPKYSNGILLLFTFWHASNIS